MTIFEAMIEVVYHYWESFSDGDFYEFIINDPIIHPQDYANTINTT